MNTKYTYEYCRKLAENCSSLKDFWEKYHSAFVTIHHNKKNEWLNSFSKEFNWKDPKKTKYTHDYCKQLACKYSSRTDFKHNELSAYTVALRKGWITEFFPNLKHRILNKETCRIIAAKYSSRSELKKGDPVAYRKICESKWMDILPASKITKCNLDYNTCQKIASKFKKRTEMMSQHPAEYNHCMRNGWLDDFFQKVVWRESSYTYDVCRNIASKSNSIADFKRRNGKAYQTSRKNGWIKDFAKEFKFLSTGEAIRKSRGFLSKSDIEKIARKYTSLKDFRIHERKVYQNAVARHLITSFTWLTRVVDEHQSWMGDTVYAYEFLDSKVVYIGRTINMERRHIEHCQPDDPISIYAKSINASIPNPILLHTGLKVAEGQIRECEEITRYQKEGWTLLNKAKGGSIGALVQRLSKEHCIEVAKRYKYLMDFEREHHREYNTLLKYGCLDECTWLKRTQVKSGTWNDYETCRKEALKYKSRGEFASSNSVAYQAAVRNNWLDKWDWLSARVVADTYWNYDRCKAEALKYTSIKEFEKNARQACKYARKNGWLAEWTWFERKRKTPGYWTYNRCKEEAAKYTSRNDFKNGSNGAYHVALDKNWIEKWKWLTPVSRPASYWTYDTCKKEAKKYKSRREFKYGCRAAYTISVQNKWIYEWFPQAQYKKTKVGQFSLDGLTLINTYESIAEAAKAVGVSAPSISNVCSGKGRTAKGYVWKYIL